MRYNNSGYHLLGAIIEKVTEKTYAETLNEKILQPIGMSDSGFDTSETILKNRASGYRITPEGFQNATYLDMGIPYAAGSMYSTVDDLFKWHQALYDTTVLSEASKALMFKPGKQDYGYGFFIQDRNVGGETVKTIQHGGGINGFNCLFTRVVDQKHLVVILDNIGAGNHHSKMTRAVVNILNDQPFENAKKPLGPIINKLALDDSAAAIAKYRSLKQESADTYDFKDEGHLNALGYELLGLDKTKDAIEIFKLNVEMFPESANPYDSLGEAYLKGEQKELALENYKKSLELDPANMGAAQAIKVIEGKAEKVDPAVLESYIGEYELGPGFIVVITVEDGFLKGQPTGQEKITLAPIGKDKFFVAAVKATVTFERDEDDNVKGLILDQEGQIVPAKKTK